MDWRHALNYAENSLFAGYSDWRLPTIKELNSIVDFDSIQGEAFIDEDYFMITETSDPEGASWYPYFWSSSTLLEGAGDRAIYQTFGRSLGMENGILYDAHGAGAVRGDPKSGEEAEYPKVTVGYQGDIQYVFNYVRLVRDINEVDVPDLTYPIVETNTTICYDDFHAIECPKAAGNFFGQDGSYAPVAYLYEDSETTEWPIMNPSTMPTATSTNEETKWPTKPPSGNPTSTPTIIPMTNDPSAGPTEASYSGETTGSPTWSPSENPTLDPTVNDPVIYPTVTPSSETTQFLSGNPTTSPTIIATTNDSLVPTKAPSTVGSTDISTPTPSNSLDIIVSPSAPVKELDVWIIVIACLCGVSSFILIVSWVYSKMNSNRLKTVVPGTAV